MSSYQPGQDILSDDPVHNVALVPADSRYLAGRVLDALNLSLALVLEGGYEPSQYEAVENLFYAHKRAITKGNPLTVT